MQNIVVILVLIVSAVIVTRNNVVFAVLYVAKPKSFADNANLLVTGVTHQAETIFKYFSSILSYIY